MDAALSCLGATAPGDDAHSVVDDSADDTVVASPGDEPQAKKICIESSTPSEWDQASSQLSLPPIIPPIHVSTSQSTHSYISVLLSTIASYEKHVEWLQEIRGKEQDQFAKSQTTIMQLHDYSRVQDTQIAALKDKAQRKAKEDEVKIRRLKDIIALREGKIAEFEHEGRKAGLRSRLKEVVVRVVAREEDDDVRGNVRQTKIFESKESQGETRRNRAREVEKTASATEDFLQGGSAEGTDDMDTSSGPSRLDRLQPAASTSASVPLPPTRYGRKRVRPQDADALYSATPLSSTANGKMKSVDSSRPTTSPSSLSVRKRGRPSDASRVVGDRPMVAVSLRAQEAQSSNGKPPKNKPFKCPVEGCIKEYQQANGLGYHLKTGTCQVLDAS